MFHNKEFPIQRFWRRLSHYKSSKKNQPIYEKYKPGYVSEKEWIISTNVKQSNFVKHLNAFSPNFYFTPLQEPEVNWDNISTEFASHLKTKIYSQYSDAPLSDYRMKQNLQDMHLSQLTRLQSEILSYFVHGPEKVYVKCPRGADRIMAYAFPITLSLLAQYPKLAMEHMSRDQNGQQFVSGLILTSKVAPHSMFVAQIIRKLSTSSLLRVKRVKYDELIDVDHIGSGCHIAVGTPNEVLHYLKKQKISLKACQYLVVDGFNDQINEGVSNEIQEILYNKKIGYVNSQEKRKMLIFDSCYSKLNIMNIWQGFAQLTVKENLPKDRVQYDLCDFKSVEEAKEGLRKLLQLHKETAPKDRLLVIWNLEPDITWWQQENLKFILILHGKRSLLSISDQNYIDFCSGKINTLVVQKQMGPLNIYQWPALTKVVHFGASKNMEDLVRMPNFSDQTSQAMVNCTIFLWKTSNLQLSKTFKTILYALKFSGIPVEQHLLDWFKITEGDKSLT